MLQGFSFIRIRFLQVVYEGRALGFIYSSLLIAALFFSLFIYRTAQLNGNYFIISNLILSLAVFFIHRNRNDHAFINVISDRPVLIKVMEYNAFIFPFLLLSVLTSFNPLVLFLPVICVMIAIIPVNRKINLDGIGIEKLVPEMLFEWRAGLRKQGIYFLLLWITGIGIAFLPYAALIISWILLFIVSSFYEEGESRDMLVASEKSPGKYLYEKLIRHLFVFFLFIAPLFIIYVIFFPMKWWVVLLFVLFGLMNLSLFIVSKYSVYIPGESTRVNSLLNAICMSSLFIPFLLPLPMFLLIRNYRRALKNLQFYLHDFN